MTSPFSSLLVLISLIGISSAIDCSMANGAACEIPCSRGKAKDQQRCDTFGRTQLSRSVCKLPFRRAHSYQCSSIVLCKSPMVPGWVKEDSVSGVVRGSLKDALNTECLIPCGERKICEDYGRTQIMLSRCVGSIAYICRKAKIVAGSQNLFCPQATNANYHRTSQCNWPCTDENNIPNIQGWGDCSALDPPRTLVARVDCVIPVFRTHTDGRQIGNQGEAVLCDSLQALNSKVIPTITANPVNPSSSVSLLLLVLIMVLLCACLCYVGLTLGCGAGFFLAKWRHANVASKIAPDGYVTDRLVSQ